MITEELAVQTKKKRSKIPLAHFLGRRRITRAAVTTIDSQIYPSPAYIQPIISLTSIPYPL
jgi:hypothetical protein